MKWWKGQSNGGQDQRGHRDLVVKEQGEEEEACFLLPLPLFLPPFINNEGIAKSPTPRGGGIESVSWMLMTQKRVTKKYEGMNK